MPAIEPQQELQQGQHQAGRTACGPGNCQNTQRFSFLMFTPPKYSLRGHTIVFDLDEI